MSVDDFMDGGLDRALAVADEEDEEVDVEEDDEVTQHL